MPFSTFLDRMQKMFNIFQEEGEELTENAKVCEIVETCTEQPATRHRQGIAGLVRSGQDLVYRGSQPSNIGCL